MTVKRPDYFTPEGASDLSRQITAYWRKRGHAVSCWIVPVIVHKNVIGYAVRSDLVDGNPPAMRLDSAAYPAIADHVAAARRAALGDPTRRLDSAA